MVWTGLCLWAPTMNWPLMAWATGLVGGAMSMRIIHYYGMFVFIIFMFIHIYLANVEGLAPTKLMFLRKEHGGLVYDPGNHNICGADPNPGKDDLVFICKGMKKGGGHSAAAFLYFVLSDEVQGYLLSTSNAAIFAQHTNTSSASESSSSVGIVGAMRMLLSVGSLP